ncbi:MAG: conserved lipoprotein/antigen [Mycobacterium sp.]|nr:conserved lipoprotein/antigen [Mycobacterium sp.]
MKIGFAVVGAAALVIGSLAGCSSGPAPATPPPGGLPAGTAEITINNKSTGTTQAVSCQSTESLLTITTGDDATGITAAVSNKEALTAESVGIRNLGDFTGSYQKDLGDDASVSVTGRTYKITGTADGFNFTNPSFRTSGSFAIKVSC